MGRVSRISDRLGALGGTLDVTSSPGAGTVVRGSLPIDAASRATVGVLP